MTAGEVILLAVERAKLTDPTNWRLSEVICSEELGLLAMFISNIN